MEKEVVQELIEKGFCSIKYGKLDLIVLTLPFAQKVGFKMELRK